MLNLPVIGLLGAECLDPVATARGSVVSAATLQSGKCLHYNFEVGEVRYESVWAALD